MVLTQDKTQLRAVTPNEGSNDLDGYYCIKRPVVYCQRCDFRAGFVHLKKQIVVWPDNDNETILHIAQLLKEEKKDPKIIEYKAMMGKAVEWDDIPVDSIVHA